MSSSSLNDIDTGAYTIAKYEVIYGHVLEIFRILDARSKESGKYVDIS